MTDTAFIYYAPHPAHKNFAEAIDADFYPLLPDESRPHSNGLVRMLEYVRSGMHFPRGYDNYLLEGGRTLVSAATFGLLNDDSNIILLNADETFVNIVEDLGHYGFGESYVHRLCLKYIDGLMNVGEFVGKYAREAGLSVPAKTVYPSVSESNYSKLSRTNPAIGSKNIVSVAVGKPSVGFDILVEAFSRIRESHPSSELHIAGRDHPSAWNDRDGVTVHGWVKSLPGFFKQGELSVHPGRSECFPVATLEPLCAGIPSVVSEMVGTKEVMGEIDEHLVTEVDITAVSRAIDWYFNQPESYREDMSNTASQLSKQFTEENCADRFRRQFEALVSGLSE